MFNGYIALIPDETSRFDVVDHNAKELQVTLNSIRKENFDSEISMIDFLRFDWPKRREQESKEKRTDSVHRLRPRLRQLCVVRISVGHNLALL